MKNRMGIITLILLSISIGYAKQEEKKKDVAGKPNIIFFITDDMYPDMFNFLPEGKGKNLTPNIDRLAKEGTIMMNQYVVSPVCTPSRYNCLTGKYASRAQNDWFLEKTKEEEGQTVIQWNTYITDKEKVLPQTLQEAGYKTGMVGKNHVIEVNDLEKFPDYWADPRDPEIMAVVKRNYTKTRQAILNTGFDFAESIYFNNPNFIGLGKLAVQNMDWIAQGGVNFIEKYKDESFFLYFATTIPHQPAEPERSWRADPRITANGYLDKPPCVLPKRETLPERIKEAGLEGDNKELVLWLDDALGALLDKLEEHNILDNTLIFFFNDHGQKAKGSLYQGGIRNPSIVWKSGGFNCGNKSHANIQNIDFAPTILEYANAENVKSDFDGRSFKPVLDGKEIASRESLFFELGYARAVIKGNYKYYALRYPGYAQNMTSAKRTEVLKAYNEPREIRKLKTVNQDPAAPFSHFSIVPGGECAENESYGKLPGYFDPDQLYDLKNDPGEIKNLAKNPEHAKKLEEMKGALKSYLDQLPGNFGELKL